MLWGGLLAIVVALGTTLPGAGSQVHPAATPSSRHGTSKPAASSPAPQALSRSAEGSPSSRLAQIQEQLASRRRRLTQVVRQERWALAALAGAQERLERAMVHLTQTGSALAGTQQAVRSATQALQAVTARLSVHETLMGTRVRAFYERGPIGYMDMLFGAANIRDFIARSYLITRIIERDLALYHAVAAERQQHDEVRTTLVIHQEQLREERDQWIARREETTRLAEERRRLLDRVRSERQSQEAAIRELEAESARITDIIRQAPRGQHRGPVQTLRNGALLWPVPGPISSGYGWRIHPIFHTREFHTGIDIAAPYGTPIQAVQEGTVIFDGWMRGYGMLVILDHGNGLSTTYSHLSSSLVHVGQHVTRGEVIARIGSTGWSTGPHLLFEIREDGRPVNPLGE
jgi:murein DD-endopeptidase MepM/ murein hydrolase activator NlpD